MSKTFTFQKGADGHLRVIGKRDYDEWVSKLPIGTYSGEFKRQGSARTSQQNRYLHGVVLPSIEDQLVNHFGWDALWYYVVLGVRIPAAVNAENLKEYLTSGFAVHKKLSEVPRTSEMDRPTFCEFLKYIQDWAHENGIAVPAPINPTDMTG